jgi:hypothetical protein
MFSRGQTYSRNQIADEIGYPEDKRQGGAFFTGSIEHEGSFYLFANVGTAGRTGHDYANRWILKDLLTTGRTGSHRGQPSIRRRISGESPVHIFWRASDRGDFTYAGEARAIEISDTVPVEILWAFDGEVPSGEANSHVRNADVSGSEPIFRRGPRPRTGRREYEQFDRGGFAYVLILASSVDELLEDDALYHVKIGCSNDLDRRLSELNAGFPYGFGWKWRLLKTSRFASASEAFDRETELLEFIRANGYWTSGEFGRMKLKEARELLPSSANTLV